MKIKDVNKVCIVDIAGNAISKSDLINLKRLFKENVFEKRIGINLKNVSSLEPQFLEFIKKTSETEKLSIFNVDNEVYLLLFITKHDKHVSIYLNEEDFCADKNSIVYRRLKIVKNAA